MKTEHMEKAFAPWHSSIILISLRVAMGQISDFFPPFAGIFLQSFLTQSCHILYCNEKHIAPFRCQ